MTPEEETTVDWNYYYCMTIFFVNRVVHFIFREPAVRRLLGIGLSVLFVLFGLRQLGRFDAPTSPIGSIELGLVTVVLAVYLLLKCLILPLHYARTPHVHSRRSRRQDASA